MVWCVLYEGVSWTIIISGFFLGALSAVFANVFLSTNQLTSAYRLNLPMILVFVVVLIFRIYKSGISVIPFILKGKSRTGIIDIETTVPEGLASTTLANAITLTPGTVTIEKKGQRIKVLWLDKSTDDPIEAAVIINGPLEGILKKAAKHD